MDWATLPFGVPQTIFQTQNYIDTHLPQSFK